MAGPTEAGRINRLVKGLGDASPGYDRTRPPGTATTARNRLGTSPSHLRTRARLHPTRPNDAGNGSSASHLQPSRSKLPAPCLGPANHRRTGNGNWNKAQFVHALQANRRTPLPLKASVLRRVHAWESGDSCPDDFYKKLIAKTFGIPVTAIWPELVGTRQWGGALNHTALLTLVDDLTGRDLITALAAADTALEPGAASDEISELALVGLIRIGLRHIRDHTQTTVAAPAPPPLDDAHSPNDRFTALASITRNSSAFIR